MAKSPAKKADDPERPDAPLVLTPLERAEVLENRRLAAAYAKRGLHHAELRRLYRLRPARLTDDDEDAKPMPEVADTLGLLQLVVRHLLAKHFPHADRATLFVSFGNSYMARSSHLSIPVYSDVKGVG